MTLTPADLARIESTAPTSLSSGELVALTALARRGLELESALEFLAKDSELFDLWFEDIAGGEYFCADPHRRLEIGLGTPTAAVMEHARVCGWPGLQSEGRKEQGEHG